MTSIHELLLHCGGGYTHIAWIYTIYTFTYVRRIFFFALENVTFPLLHLTRAHITSARIVIIIGNNKITTIILRTVVPNKSFIVKFLKHFFFFFFQLTQNARKRTHNTTSSRTLNLNANFAGAGAQRSNGDFLILLPRNVF